MLCVCVRDRLCQVDQVMCRDELRVAMTGCAMTTMTLCGMTYQGMSVGSVMTIRVDSYDMRARARRCAIGVWVRVGLGCGAGVRVNDDGMTGATGAYDDDGVNDVVMGAGCDDNDDDGALGV